jgi:hypothetical protein
MEKVVFFQKATFILKVIIKLRKKIINLRIKLCRKNTKISLRINNIKDFKVY